MNWRRWFKKDQAPSDINTERRLLEEKTVRGAKKALTEYRRVFERLAEYDRT